MFQKIVLIIGILLIGISVHAANVINPPVIKILKNKNHVQYKIFNHKSKFKFSKKQAGISENNDIGTLIWDLNGFIHDKSVDCDILKETVVEKMFSELFENNFYYSIQIDCDADNRGFHLLGMFDPMDDAATLIGQNLISRWEGTNFYGTPFHFETAKAVVYYLSATIGKMENGFLTRYVFLVSSYKFNSLHEAVNGTLREMWINFKPTNAEIILPMIAKVFGSSNAAGEALHRGNAIEILFFPTILYGENLKDFPTGVGFGEILGNCTTEGKVTCL